MLTILKTRSELLIWRSQFNQPSLGLVPTMGNLHKGHGSLIEESLKNNQTTVVTIFVNPTQFGPNEDFANYPRTLDDDVTLISKISSNYPSKNIIVYAPRDSNEIYGEKFNTWVEVKSMTDILCGKSRPIHFKGVTTVVTLLFNLIRPTRAYFGKKDFQQYRIIEKLTSDLCLPIEIIGMPIIRDFDGLALSSRNRYLSESERKKALILSETIQVVANLISSKSTYSFINDTIEGFIKKSNELQWDYLEFLDAKNLTPVTPGTKEILIAGALKVGKTRLIDNMVVTTP